MLGMGAEDLKKGSYFIYFGNTDKRFCKINLIREGMLILLRL